MTAMRDRLGGRVESEAGIGELVRLEPAPEMSLSGVVLFVQGDDFRVLLPGGTVRRAKADSITALTEPVDEELAALASEVRTFAKLSEGEAIRYRDPKGNLARGTLIEKCRYGALIAKTDGTIMGVGFRKIWPEAGSPNMETDQDKAEA